MGGGGVPGPNADLTGQAREVTETCRIARLPALASSPTHGLCGIGQPQEFVAFQIPAFPTTSSQDSLVHPSERTPRGESSGDMTQ